MQWSKQVMSGEVPSARRWHNLSQMHSQQQKYLLYGGYDGNYYKLLNDTFIFDLRKYLGFGRLSVFFKI
jgi:hypothetical protein